jgi:small GTP-binding protein
MGTETIFGYYSETFQLPDGSYVNCEIIDTGGQEKYNALNKIYYQRADCCVLVYDITNSKSFEECKDYYKDEILNNCKNKVKVILVGNKTDLEKQRQVTKEEGIEFAQENKYYFNAFETIIIMTNNDMIMNNELNLQSKKDIKKFKIDKGAQRLEEILLKKKKKCC